MRRYARNALHTRAYFWEHFLEVSYNFPEFFKNDFEKLQNQGNRKTFLKISPDIHYDPFVPPWVTYFVIDLNHETKLQSVHLHMSLFF